MPQQANPNNLSIGRGMWYFARMLASGVLGPLRFVGEADKAEITASVTTKERYTTTRATNNKIASVPTQAKHELSITLMEFSKENVSLALLGDTAAVTQAQTTVTNELVAGTGSTQLSKGGIYQLAKRNVSLVSLAAIASGGASTALVAGTDFEVEDATLGLITILSDTAAAADHINGNYTAGIVNASRVTAGSVGKINGMWIFKADPTSGPKMNVKIYASQVEPSGAVALLSDDFSSMPLTVEILQDPAQALLYEVVYPG